jgi:predicted transcriptional regulator
METPAEIRLEYTLNKRVGEVAAVSRRSVHYIHTAVIQYVLYMPVC